MRLRPTTLIALALIALGVWVMLGGDRLLSGGAPATPSATVFATSRPPTTEFPTATPGPRAIPDGYRVQIPRLQIDLPIKEGDFARDIDNQQTPEHAAFHLPGTAIPGEGGNSYIYAHARTGMFLALWDAKVGDEVIIVVPSPPDGRTRLYVVSEVHPRVPYNETSWVLPTPTERLTLQTSTGPNPQDPRFVVVALPQGRGR